MASASGGALAANVYRAETRFTQDLDLLLNDPPPGIAPVEAALRAAGWQVRRVIPDAMMLRARHPDHGDLDLVVAETAYQVEALARAREEPQDHRLKRCAGRPALIFLVDGRVARSLLGTAHAQKVESVFLMGRRSGDHFKGEVGEGALADLLAQVQKSPDLAGIRKMGPQITGNFALAPAEGGFMAFSVPHIQG